MKRLIVLSMIVPVIALAGSIFTPSHAQTTAKDEKPTFYRLTPGFYVNGWPRFTITYPKDWVEVRGRPESLFSATPPGPTPNLSFSIVVTPWPLPLDKFAETTLRLHQTWGTGVTLVSDKPVQLRDGSPAREVVLQGMLNGVPYTWLDLTTKRSDATITVALESRNVKMGEDQKAIAHSLEFQPGFDEPVKLPPDVQAFIDQYCGDVVSHDLEKIMSHYSDTFLNSGTKKGEIEQILRQIIGPITSFEINITDFVQAGDRAYLTGFTRAYWGKGMFGMETSIVKENGMWKFYGNQRDVVAP